MSLNDSIVSFSSDINSQGRHDDIENDGPSKDQLLDDACVQSMSMRVLPSNISGTESQSRSKKKLAPKIAADIGGPTSKKLIRAEGRIGVREQRKIEKQLQKASAFRNLVSERMKHGYYCKQETGLILSESVYNSELGIILRKAKVDSDEDDDHKERERDDLHQYPILRPYSEDEIGYLPSIWWNRGSAHVTGLNSVRITFREGIFSCTSSSSIDTENRSEASRFDNVEPCVIIYLTGLQYIDLVHEKSFDSIQSLFETWKNELPPCFKLIVLVTGLKRAWQKRYTDAGKEISKYVSYEAYEHFAANVFVTVGVELLFIESVEKAAVYIQRTTKSVAEMPYRTTPSAMACTTKVKVSGKFKPYKHNPRDSLVGENSILERILANFQCNTSSEAWWMMLQMIPGVSPSVANAIVSKVPSYHDTMQIYLDPNLSDNAKRSLFEVSILRYMVFV